MLKTYKITLIAEQDLIGIYTYTLQKWGVVKAEKYIKNLYDRFNWLADNPMLGINQEAIKIDYRSYFEGSHSIFYLIDKKSIEIIGIIHQNEDVNKRFK